MISRNFSSFWLNWHSNQWIVLAVPRDIKKTINHVRHTQKNQYIFHFVVRHFKVILQWFLTLYISTAVAVCFVNFICTDKKKQKKQPPPNNLYSKLSDIWGQLFNSLKSILKGLIYMTKVFDSTAKSLKKVLPSLVCSFFQIQISNNGTILYPDLPVTPCWINGAEKGWMDGMMQENVVPVT